jgi:hypothetical protein
MDPQRHLSPFLLTIFTFALTFLVTACGGSSGDGGDDDSNSSSDYAVEVTLKSVTSSGVDIEFRSNDVFTNYVGDFALSFSAVDGDFTILVSVQSVVGDPLLLGTHLMGEDDIKKVFTSASVVYDDNRGNTVFNATIGDGAIFLSAFSAAGARGEFMFKASTLGDGTSINVTGKFDVVFN